MPSLLNKRDLRFLLYEFLDTEALLAANDIILKGMRDEWF
jgi:hypothetical protein